MKLIVDPGSTHCGNKDECYMIIEAAKKAGADAVKFQLFPKSMEGENVCLPYHWMCDLVKRGEASDIEVFASVFDEQAAQVLSDSGAKSVKLSYNKSMDERLWRKINYGAFEWLYISGDVMTPWEKVKAGFNGQYLKTVSLFCVPQYPVYSFIDLEAVERTGLFQGFSDHTLGINVFREHKIDGTNWVYWEKHVRPDAPLHVTPDARFAVTFREVEKMCSGGQNTYTSVEV